MIGIKEMYQKKITEKKPSFLMPKGPARSQFYPPRKGVLWVSFEDILMKAEASTATGRCYIVTENDQKTANDMLKNKI